MAARVTSNPARAATMPAEPTPAPEVEILLTRARGIVLTGGVHEARDMRLLLDDVVGAAAARMPRDLVGTREHPHGRRAGEQRQRTPHVRVRNRGAIAVEAHGRLFAGTHRGEPTIDGCVAAGRIRRTQRRTPSRCSHGSSPSRGGVAGVWPTRPSAPAPCDPDLTRRLGAGESARRSRSQPLGRPRPGHGW
jgi:hypothetical protein